MIENSYKVSLPDSKTLIVEDTIGNHLGRIHFPSMWSYRSIISLSNGFKLFALNKGMFDFNFDLKPDEQSDTILAQIKSNWKGNMTINIYLENEDVYKVKSKSIWKNEFILYDDQDRELLSLTSKWLWKSFKYEYLIRATEQFFKINYGDLLLMTSIKAMYILISNRRQSSS